MTISHPHAVVPVRILNTLDKAQTIGAQTVVVVAKLASSVVELEIPEQTSDCSAESVEGNVTTSAQNILTKRKVSNAVADLLHRHKDVVSLSEHDVGRSSRIGHHINTGYTRPIKPHPHRTSPSKK